MTKRLLTLTLLLQVLLVNILLAQSVAYQDVPYIQDYSVKYILKDSSVQLKKAYADRNGTIHIISSKGLLKPANGAFQYPGTLEADRAYITTAKKKITDLGIFENQLVYLDDKAVFSNAWAGKWFTSHGLSSARLFANAPGFISLVSDGSKLQIIQDKQILWESQLAGDQVLDIKYDSFRTQFVILGNHSVSVVPLKGGQLKSVFEKQNLTCFEVTKDKIYLGTPQGYLTINAVNYQPIGDLYQKLPCNNLTAIAFLNGKLWFGSTMGAFMLREDGKFNYYLGGRWLPGDVVKHISAGNDKNVLILTDKGLAELNFKPLTLAEKATIYDKQVRQRHIRYGFNCDVVMLQNGDLSTAEMGPRESDNLWTSMYMVSQLFRYKVTGSPEARQNYLESFEAMQRLFDITNMSGYFARGFERKEGPQTRPDGKLQHGWTSSQHPEWDWKGTTSSDQTVGQMFALTLLAELGEPEVKQKAIQLMDQLMTNIIENDWYLIDFDGKPTLWGKWNPEYVNGFPVSVGDRKVYSSNIIGFLQAAHHFTGKKIFKEKAYELMNKHGYLENLARPMSEIHEAPADADEWAKELSEEWNHSDDEMYFLAYWCLYPYAFTPELKSIYGKAIKDHWNAERPEKNGLWNLCYAMTGAKAFDKNETIWFLKEFPLDMVEWTVRNSHRKDLEFLEPNFRRQSTKEVLPPDERPELKHNRNLFTLDRLGHNGGSELSAGDSFLLPYWMGRYLGVISGPKK
jgi:hypothetical protein